MTSRIALGLALGIVGVSAGTQNSEAQTYTRTPTNQDEATTTTTQPETRKSRQTGWYLGATAGSLAVDDGNGQTAVMGAIGARLGYAPIRQLAFEAEAAVGVIPQTYVAGASEYDLNLKSEFGVFIVGRIPVSENFLVFGRVGAASAKLEADFGTGVIVADDYTTGLGAGIGMEWATSGPSIRADITGYDFNGSASASASVSILARF